MSKPKKELSKAERLSIKKELRGIFDFHRRVIWRRAGPCFGTDEFITFLRSSPVAVVQHSSLAHLLLPRIVCISSDPWLAPIFRSLIELAAKAKPMQLLVCDPTATLVVPVLAELAAIFILVKAANDGVTLSEKPETLAALIAVQKEVLLRQASTSSGNGLDAFRGRSVVSTLMRMPSSTVKDPPPPLQSLVDSFQPPPILPPPVVPPTLPPPTPPFPPRPPKKYPLLQFPEKFCTKCGGRGHVVSECGPVLQVEGRSCPRCGGEGHWHKQCPAQVVRN